MMDLTDLKQVLAMLFQPTNQLCALLGGRMDLQVLLTGMLMRLIGKRGKCFPEE